VLLLTAVCCALQDVSGGLPVKVESPFGGELPLYGMQIDLEQARTELRTAVAGGGTAGACKRSASYTGLYVYAEFSLPRSSTEGRTIQRYTVCHRRGLLTAHQYLVVPGCRVE
jgi:hypothetical protein